MKIGLIVFLFFAQFVLAQSNDTIFSGPHKDGHPEFVQAINEAKSSIDLAMFRITDQQVINSLKGAVARSVKVRMIVDGASVQKDQKLKLKFDDLKNAGVEIYASSPLFAITHEKAMVIDKSLAFITTENLTRTSLTTRDFGIETHDPSIIAEFSNVFNADINNSKNGTNITPPLSNNSLLWSPVNAESKLESLLKTATKSIILYVENLSNSVIVNALIEAAKRGVEVKVMTPLCDKNEDPYFDLDALRKLKSNGVSAHAMPPPESFTQPYIHAKAITIDDEMIYVGSMNFSNQSLLRAREVGIILSNKDMANYIKTNFIQDWNFSMDVPATNDAIQCPKFN